MSSLILTTFIVLGSVLCAIAFHSAWLLTKHTKSVVTWIYPVMVVLIAVMSWKGVVDIQGYPINAKPKGNWEYLTHYDEGGPVLVIVKENNESKTYRFVPTEKEKKALEQGKEAKDKGQRLDINIDGPLPKMELIRIDQENPK